MNREIRINARNLSSPGPKLLVENALSSGKCSMLKVVVSSFEAAEEVREYLEEKGAGVEVDRIADDYFIIATFDV